MVAGVHQLQVDLAHRGAKVLNHVGDACIECGRGLASAEGIVAAGLEPEAVLAIHVGPGALGSRRIQTPCCILEADRDPDHR